MLVQEFKYSRGTRVLVWRLDEEAPQLLALCQEQGIPCDDLIDQPVKRQREKAAERLLLCQAFGAPVKLAHDEQGAPYIEGGTASISITHTPRIVAVAINRKCVIGLDAEQKDRHQVLRVRDKFLNFAEQQFINSDDLTAHIIAWTAKEAVIKAERNSAIDWTEEIRLQPFVSGAEETSLMAQCGNRSYRLTARFVEGHYITLALPVAK